MEAHQQQQLFDQLNTSQRILIAIPANPNADSLGSALAMAGFLKKLGKEADLACVDLNAANFPFLEGAAAVRVGAEFSRVFVVSVDISATPLAELSYHEADGKINIELLPKSGSFSASDLSTSVRAPAYDLIICVDTPSLERLGALYEKNAELFFNTPKVNIDNHIGNENFGNLNIVDITAAATAEVMFGLLKEFDPAMIDRTIATALLAGIIAETNSFQSGATTPNSFQRASELVSLGANQQEIVKYLFKTKSLSMLKVLGRAMARIRKLPDGSATYAVVTAQDLEKSEANDEDILRAVQELSRSIPDLRLLFVAIERTEGRLEVYVFAGPNVKLSEVVHQFGGRFIDGSFGVFELRDTSLSNFEQRLADSLEKLRPRLGL